MRVKDLIKELLEYNQEATVDIVVDSYGHDFEICTCGGEGCTKKDCDEVDLCVIGMHDAEVPN